MTDIAKTSDQVSVTLTTGDVEIGAIELKNATDDTRAKIGALSGIASTDNGLPVCDPLGAREAGGHLASLDTKITTCNTGAIAGAVTANAGTNLNTSALAVETGGHLEEAADHVHSIDGKITACNTGAIVGTVGLTSDSIAINCNKPVAVAIAAATWTDISAGLVANARYELLYIPTVPTDEVYFWLRDDTAANLTVETTGRPCRSGAPIPITPSGATPLAILRHSATAFDGTVYLTRVDN